MTHKVKFDMDFGEERKAFDAAQVEIGYTHVTDANTLAFAFQMWIKAKVAAMPVADIFLRKTHVGTAWTNAADHSMGCVMYETKEAAEEGAKKLGYRLP